MKIALIALALCAFTASTISFAAETVAPASSHKALKVASKKKKNKAKTPDATTELKSETKSETKTPEGAVPVEPKKE